MERRYNDEMYKGYAIRVLATRISAGAGWAIEVHIQGPDGGHLPTIRDNDRSFEQLEIAFATGSESGRAVVDSG
jgi:hypothetical protein